MIRTDRLELVSLDEHQLRALLARDLARVGASIEATIPHDLHGLGLADRFLRLRLADLAIDPEAQPWLARVMVRHDGPGDRRVVGSIGFHSRPWDGRAEVGYHVGPLERRQGFATEAVTALFDWAACEEGIHRFRASVAPLNAPSLALVRRFGFQQVGVQIDPEDGEELVFEIDWPGG
jgi:ribosomal-protein-alanine N-acetyltransferase